MASKRTSDKSVIVISGPHGSGKTTYAKLIAEMLGLRYVSAGELFRRIAEERNMTLEELTQLAEKDRRIDEMVDEVTKREAKAGGVVIDAQLGAHMAKDEADIKIYLTAPFEVRVRRIAERDGISYDEAAKQTALRESVQKQRFMRYYGINVDDLSVYDIVLDTSGHEKQEVVKILMQKINERLHRPHIEKQEAGSEA